MLLSAIIIIVLAIIIAFVVNQQLIRLNQEETATQFNAHRYPQSSFTETSNLQIKAVITEVSENYTTQGMMLGNYHIYRYFLRVNITEIVWISQDYAKFMRVSIENKTIFDWNTISVGYDNLDNPQFLVGQNVECKGFYEPTTDSSWSLILTISPSITESYLKLI